MKQSLYLALVGATVLFAGCSDGKLPGGWSSTTGGITPTVSVDASVATSARAMRAAKAVEAADLSLRLKSADGSLDRTWAKVADFDPEEEFAIGDYTMQAFYGSPDAEGFDAPYYSGTASFTVHENQSTPVSITATLANSMISISYTDAFKNYVSDWSASVSSDAGKAPVEFFKSETRPAYVAPGAVVLKVNITKPNGQTATLQAASFNAVARHHYNVTVDVNNGQVGDAVLSITIDDATDTETVNIDLSDDIISAPAPELTPVGFAPDATLSHVEGTVPASPVKLNIMARGGIASVRMTTESASLRSLGWPAETDLIAANGSMQNTLAQLGLHTLGLWKNPDKMAVVDLTEVLSHLSAASGAGNNVFTFTVTDRYSKTSEPMSLTVSLEALTLAIAGHGSMDYGSDNVDLTVAYNGADFENSVTVQIKNARGTWDNLTINSVTTAATGSYTVNVALPAPADKDLTFRVTSKSGISSAEVEVPVIEPNVQLEAAEGNVFATYAILKATGEPADDMYFEYSTDSGSTYTAASAAVYTVAGSADKYFKLSDLPSGSSLLVRVNDADHTSRPVIVDTEAATQLPESGMDNWSAEKKGDLQYLWKVGDASAWNTLNTLTTSQSGSGTGNGLSTGGCSYKSTSATIPANGRSTKSTASGGGFGTTKHSDGHTEGNATLHSDRQHSGSNAALVRTVGWGSGNTAKVGSKDNAGFGTCQNTTPGELYLGTYENNAPVYGYAFVSRPSALSFYYHYDVVTAGNGDYATVEITVYNGDGSVISTASQQLAEQSSYTNVTLPLTYGSNAPKAAKISVVFKSSGNSAALAHDTKFWRTPGGNNTSGGEYVGSELYIDDIELIY